MIRRTWYFFTRSMSTFRGFLTILVVVAIVAFLAGSILVWATNKPVDIPNTKLIITTDTRILYADVATKLKNGGVKLSDFWEVNHGRWIERKEDITLQPSVKPNVVPNPNYNQRLLTK
jgi:hypothetical protein